MNEENKPLSLGDRIDALYNRREEIRKRTRELDLLKEEFKEESDLLEGVLFGMGLMSAKGKLGKIVMSTTDVFKVENETVLADWYERGDDPDRRYLAVKKYGIDTAACREAFNADEELPPGVSRFEVTKLGLTKA